jgi:hypothetical protein
MPMLFYLIFFIITGYIIGENLERKYIDMYHRSPEFKNQCDHLIGIFDKVVHRSPKFTKYIEESKQGGSKNPSVDHHIRNELQSSFYEEFKKGKDIDDCILRDELKELEEKLLEVQTKDHVKDHVKEQIKHYSDEESDEESGSNSDVQIVKEIISRALDESPQLKALESDSKSEINEKAEYYEKIIYDICIKSLTRRLPTDEKISKIYLDASLIFTKELKHYKGGDKRQVLKQAYKVAKHRLIDNEGIRDRHALKLGLKRIKGLLKKMS